MRFSSLFIAGAALFAATAVTAKHDQVHARAVAAPAGPAFPELQARVEHTTEGDLHVRDGPSRTTTSQAVNHIKRTLRGNRDGFRRDAIRVKASIALRACSGAISVHVNTIKGHCGKANKGNINILIKLIIIELQAILALCLKCVGDIKGCGGIPVPSQPPTNPPTPWELCQCIIEIIIILQGCFSKLVILCGNHAVARTACSGVLAKISSCLCQILTTSNSIVVDADLLAIVKGQAQSAGVISVISGLNFGGFGLKGLFNVWH